MSPHDPSPVVLVVEDDVLQRVELALRLENAGFRVVSAVSAEEALEVLAAVPDIRAVVTDGGLPPGGMNGFELARKVESERGIGVLVMSGRTGPDTDELPPGVCFLAKPVHEATLVHLVRALTGSAGQPEQVLAESPAPQPARAGQRLTPRQQAVLEHLVQGKSNRDIAAALGLSENTVKVYLVTIYRVLGVSSRTEALLAGMKHRQSS
jgi:DNA-binding NarL/FixJ family response regulator